MPHFTDAYVDRTVELLHALHPVERSFRQEIFTVDGLLTAVLVTFDDVREDHRVVAEGASYERFLERMAKVKPDWREFSRENFEELAKQPHKTFVGSEGRTHYAIKGAQYADRWTPETANNDMLTIAVGIKAVLGPSIQEALRTLRDRVPVGREAFSAFEYEVRVTFNFLFRKHLGEGAAQVRTAGENEGVEIRDLIFTNKATGGFWKDLKRGPYKVSEVVVDAKNTDDLTRDDLRQLYCYLKPAVGLWGFIVCRADPSETINAFNRALFKNFVQKRGVLLLSENDLRRMVDISLRGQEPSDYLRARMTEFRRKI